MLKKFLVTVPYLVFCTTEVFADDEDDAIDQAICSTALSGFAGNGGSHRLVGPTGVGVTVETGDGCYESIADNVGIHVEEVDQ